MTIQNLSAAVIKYTKFAHTPYNRIKSHTNTTAACTKNAPAYPFIPAGAETPIFILTFI